MAATLDNRASPLEILATLVRLAERRIEDGLRASLQPFELMPREYALLSALAESSMSQQEASRALGVDRTSMVALVDRLEAAALVTRERHPTDRRAYTLVLSTAGEKRRKQAARAVAQQGNEMLADLDDKDLRRLNRSLRVLAGLGSGK